jgi:hypothetical protein
MELRISSPENWIDKDLRSFWVGVLSAIGYAKTSKYGYQVTRGGCRG